MTTSVISRDPVVVERLVQCARDILDGRIGVIEGSRFVVSIAADLGEPRPEVLRIFFGVDSQTDSLPIGAVRALWNADALAEKDAEVARAEEMFREHVFRACRELMALLLAAPGPETAEPWARSIEVYLSEAGQRSAAPWWEIDDVVSLCREVLAYGEGPRHAQLIGELRDEIRRLAERWPSLLPERLSDGART